jgi:hypothetical protein
MFKIQKVLHGFYNQFVKFQRILAYILKIFKTYFWQRNILFTFNIKIKKTYKDLNIQNIIKDNNLLLFTFNIRIKENLYGVEI